MKGYYIEWSAPWRNTTWKSDIMPTRLDCERMLFAMRMMDPSITGRILEWNP